MNALTRPAAPVQFVLAVWITLLILGRRAANGYADLHEGLTSWARGRRWTVGTQQWYLLVSAAGAERVVLSAGGAVGGCTCTILYCTGVESYFVACALRLPGAPDV